MLLVLWNGLQTCRSSLSLATGKPSRSCPSSKPLRFLARPCVPWTSRRASFQETWPVKPKCGTQFWRRCSPSTGLPAWPHPQPSGGEGPQQTALSYITELNVKLLMCCKWGSKLWLGRWQGSRAGIWTLVPNTWILCCFYFSAWMCINCPTT